MEIQMHSPKGCSLKNTSTVSSKSQGHFRYKNDVISEDWSNQAKKQAHQEHNDIKPIFEWIKNEVPKPVDQGHPDKCNDKKLLGTIGKLNNAQWHSM